MHSIGIDLGTTYSCVVHYSSDGTELLVENADGAELTPSVVHIDEHGEVMVGRSAKDRMATDGENVIVGIKRHMGTDYPLEYAGRTLTPEGVSALILKSLAEDASVALGIPVAQLHAVITIPAYFGIAEKEATAAAARIAELHCPELVPEPVAAAIAYGVADDESATSVVFDLGGGTLDVAIVGVDGGRPRIWAVDGERRLGGLDWDHRIQDLVWEKVDELENADDLRFDDNVVAGVESSSELLKRRLTMNESVSERIRVGNQTVRLSISRADFAARTQDLLRRALDATDRAIAAAGAAHSGAPTQVLLVGGSTRMPMVREALNSHLGLPVLLTDPDRVVARGAAIHSEQLLGASRGRTMVLRGITRRARDFLRITPVLPRTVGILVHSSAEPWREEPYVMPLVAANSPLPIDRRRFTFASICDGQERTRVQLFEQGGTQFSPNVSDNRPLIDGEIVLSPGLPGGSPLGIDVSISVDGRVALQAVDERGRHLTLEAYMAGVLDDEEVAAQASATTSLRLAR